MEHSCHFGYRTIRNKRVYTCIIKSATIIELNQQIKIAYDDYSIDSDEETKNGPVQVKVEVAAFINSTIYYIPKGFGQYFLNLSMVQICNCGLKAISRGDLDGLEKLKELWIYNNELVSLPSNLFTKMQQLEVLSFADNKLEFITSELFQPIKQSIKFVDLSKNTRIDAIFDSSGYKGRFLEQNAISLTQLLEMIDTQCYKPVEDAPVLNDETFPEQFCKGLSELWMSGRQSDFVVGANESKSFRVHKSVLTISSPVFAAMFELDVEETRSGSMNISDFQASAVEHFLAFLYTGRIPDGTNAMELYALAIKYDVVKLKTISEEVIMNSITEANAFEIFTLGHLHSAVNMKQKSFDVIRKMFPGKSMSDDMMEDPEHLQKMVEAKRSCESKIQEAEKEFLAAAHMRKLKIQQAQDDYKEASRMRDQKVQQAQHAFDVLCLKPK